MWIDGYIHENDLNYIIEKLIDENISLDSYQINKIFERINDENEKTNILKIFILKIIDVNNLKKYNKVKSIIEITNLSEQLKIEFLISSYKICSLDFKIKLFLDFFWQ